MHISHLVAQTVKHLPAMWETQVQFLGQEDPLEKEMATRCSVLAGEYPMDKGACLATVHEVTRVRHNLVTKPPLQVLIQKALPSELALANLHLKVCFLGN